ncbi:KTSC domain-containing protein [Xanthomonas arboricola]|uniref:KTSC domain-containing protein n=1 Tax=Xanthomonas arboricola TaxID=56448 RepID=UPI000E1E642B|nr:KTSC domain-containing protein [Xanthomonas arboricola]
MNAPLHITLHDVESRQIAAIGHDASTQTLAVRFKNWKGDVTSLYHYDNVTADDYAALQAAESKGGYFNKVIKADPVRWPYRKVEDRPLSDAA